MRLGRLRLSHSPSRTESMTVDDHKSGYTLQQHLAFPDCDGALAYENGDPPPSSAHVSCRRNWLMSNKNALIGMASVRQLR